MFGTIFGVFIGLLIICWVLSVIFPGKSPEEKEKRYSQADSWKVFSCELAGVRHHNGKAVPGGIVELNHDPYNEYDKNAIEVKTLDGRMIGFIPKSQNKKVLDLWGDGELFGKVTGVYWRHTEVHIDIYKFN